VADDVEIGIDGSDAESGVRRILSSLDKVGKASDSLAKKASSDFQKIFDKLKSIGDSSIISKYEKMTGSMERAAAKVQRSHAVMSANIAQSSSKTAASIGHMTSSLAKLEGFKGPSKSGVRNTQDLLNVVGSMKAVNTAGLSSLAGISGFKGPSGSAVKNTQILLQALSGSKLSSTLTRLSVLDNITNFRGPSSRSVDNTQRLLDVISRARFSSGSGLGEAAALLNSIGNAGARLGGTATRAGAASSALTRLGGASRQGATGLGALAQQADRTNQALFHTERFFGTLANVAGLSFLANEINKMESSGAAIQTVTNNLAATSQEMKFLTQTAQENGTYLGSLTKGYSSFRTAANAAGLALADTQNLYRGVTQASRVYNLSLDDQEGVYRALTQIMGKNSLQQEELRGQLGDRMPIAIQAMARALGVTIPVMNEMTKKGLVSGKILTDAFARLGPILEEMTQGGFTAAMNTIGAKTSALKTEAMLLSVAMGEAGMKGAINNTLVAVTNLIKEGGALYGLLMGVSQAALLLTQNMGSVLLLAMIGLIGKFNIFGKTAEFLKTSMAGLGGASVAASASTSTFARATGALTVAMDAEAKTAKVLAAEKRALIIEQRALTLATAQGLIATDKAVISNRLLAASMGTLGTAAASAVAPVTAVAAGSGALMRVSSGRQIPIMTSSLGLLAKGAKGAMGAVSALLAVVGLTNPWLIAAALIVGLGAAYAHFAPVAREARQAQKDFEEATKLASSAAFAGAADLNIYTESLANMGAEARKTVLELEAVARAQARASLFQSQSRIRDFMETDTFDRLAPAQQQGLRTLADPRSTHRDRLATGDATLDTIQPMADSAPGFWTALMDFSGNSDTAWEDGKRLQGLVASIGTVTSMTTAELQGMSQAVARSGGGWAEMIRLTGMTEVQLRANGVNFGSVAAAAVSSSNDIGSAASRAANRVRPLNMTLEEYVQNLTKVRDANENLAALGLSNVGIGGQSGDSEITGVSIANANRRLHALQTEREALELGADTWKRYLDSLTTTQKSGLESDFADQIRVERNNGASGTEAQRILTEAANQVPRLWEAANRVANAGPTGADRGRAIEDLTDSYNNLGGALRRYQIQVALATDAELDSEVTAGLLASVRRESILEYRDILGVQGQVLDSYHEQETTLRNLNVLSQQFGLDVTEAKIDAALRYAQALRQIVESTPEGKIQAQLRDNLMSIAEGAASSISTMLGTYTAMKQYEDTVLRSQRAIFHGFTGTNPQADATANSLADTEMNNRRAIFAMEQAAARFNSQISAIGSSIDQVGDSLTDFILGAETDFAALAMSITRELTKAFLIDPMMANFKAGISNMVMNSPISSFLGMANTAASGAASALDATSQALLTSAGTSLNAAGVSLNASGVTLNASAAVVTGSGTALVGAATGLGGVATALGGSAFALGSAAGALSAAAAVLSASGAASGGTDALAFAARMIPAVFGAPVAHSGGVIGTTAFRTRSVIGMGSALPHYHNGGIAGLKPREVLSVLKMGEEVLPEGNPRHIKNVGKFDGPQNYQAPISNTIQGDTYEIHLTVQTPTPSGNPQQDSRAQQEMAKTAAEALDSVIKQRGDKSRRTRSMSVA
jgi:tape measure domain-containing protein